MDGQAQGHGGGQQGDLVAAGGLADEQRLALEVVEGAGQVRDGILPCLGRGGEAVEDDDGVLADVTAEHAGAGGVFAHRAVSSFLLMIVCGRQTQATHQAIDGSGAAALMTAGVWPHRETADRSAPGVGWPPDTRHPDNAGIAGIYTTANRQSRGAERRGDPGVISPEFEGR